MHTRKIALVGFTILVSCSDSGTNRTERVIGKLRDCNVIGKTGDISTSGWPFGDENACFADCFLEAQCNEVKTAWCEDEEEGAGQSSIESCFERCWPDYFECKDGREASRCDGHEECEDGADERGCVDFVCANGKSIPAALKCDGDGDCSDDSDEIGCPGDEDFKCKSGEKPFEVYECDGEPDCKDGSDEVNCVGRGLLFECGDGDLVGTDGVCDGFEDCEDGSDEEQNCATSVCR